MKGCWRLYYERTSGGVKNSWELQTKGSRHTFVDIPSGNLSFTKKIRKNFLVILSSGGWGRKNMHGKIMGWYQKDTETIHVTGVPERKGKEYRAEEIFEALMTKKFPKIEDTKSQTQEAWKTPSEINIKCAHTQAYHILTAESE